MRKISLYIICFVFALLAACTNDFESTFDKAPDERANEALNGWQTTLLEAEHGWLTHYYPNPELLGGFSFLFKFKENGFVDMTWGLRDTLDDSLYSLKMMEKPLLIFDSYSIFSKMVDPDLGERGKGFGGENEFAFIKKSVDGDSIYLEERVSGDPMILVKASPTAWEDIKLYPAMEDLVERRDEQVVPFYMNLSVEGWDVKVNMVYNADMQKARLTYTENGEAKVMDMGINYTHLGFEFHHALEFSGIKARSFKYNETLNQYDVLDEGVTGAFKYEGICPSEIQGAFDKFFPNNGFGDWSTYISPKLKEEFANLNPNSGLRSFSYTPYFSGTSNWRDWKITFEDYNDIVITIDEFEKTSENTVVIHFGEYVTEGWSADYTEEEINEMMGSVAGQKLYNILFSSKGWTIVPVFIQEYGSTCYLVSNEDPEMYIYFGS